MLCICLAIVWNFWRKVNAKDESVMCGSYQKTTRIVPFFERRSFFLKLFVILPEKQNVVWNVLASFLASLAKLCFSLPKN